jgi:hypothetical protein
MLFALNVELLPDEDLSVLVAQAETALRGTISQPI